MHVHRNAKLGLAGRRELGHGEVADEEQEAVARERPREVLEHRGERGRSRGGTGGEDLAHDARDGAGALLGRERERD